ncbi:MAG: GC-type dockerin domain-anchored protein, partial [Phycisphaerales bacterium]
AFTVVLAIQPVPTLDLGTLSQITGFYSHSAPLSGNEVHWYKFIVPAEISVASNTYLDIDTENSARTDATNYDTYLALFDETGVLRSSDDDDGSGLHSQLSYGATTPTRPTWATNGAAAGVLYNGRDGTLVAGTYWLAAYGFANAVGSPATGWIVNSTSVQTGTIQMNMVYATPSTPAAPTIFENLGTLVGNGNFVTRSSAVANAGQVNWYKITLANPIAATSRTYLDIDTETSSVPATVLGLFNAATGAVVVSDTVDGTDTLSQISIGKGTRAAPGNGVAYNGRDAATLAAGEYFIAVTSAPGTVGAGWYARSIASATGGTLVVNVRTGTEPLPPPPTVLENLGTLASDGNFITRSANVDNAGQVNWYKFILATGIDRAAGSFLDIDTETSTVTTTGLALYSGATAALVISDTVDGTATLSQISIGKGTRAAPGNGVAYNGRDGVTLAAGEYYVAVTSAPATFGADYAVVSTNANTGGSLVLNIRTGTQPPATPPTTFYDIGLLHGDKTVDTENGNPIAYTPGEVRWFRFVTPQDANDVTGKYLDIDTEGSLLELITARANDTEIGVYAQNGALMGFDDDGGVDWTSLVTFGATTPARPTVGNGTARNGNDGVLPAGTYYIAFGGFNMVYAEDFIATTTSAVNGTIILHLFNNFTNVPVRCNLADVAGLGGSIGPDLQLTADDVIVYLGGFFTGDLAVADIALLGGTPGQDGQLTADDIILFLGQFFSPCNP